MHARARTMTAWIAALALAAAIPTSAVADEGGVPHSTKPCPSKDNGKPKKNPKKAAKNDKGKKCGFEKAA